MHIRNTILLLLLLACTIGTAVAAGTLDNRWGTPVDLVDAGRKLDSLPDEFGPWQRQAVQPVPADVIEMIQCTGSLHHVYRNRETGDVVSIAMFLGRPGPISVHSPEVCYSLAGHRLLERAKRFKLRDSDSDERQFWGTVFKANRLEGGILRVAYGFNAGHGWRAPDQPRMAFGGSGKLYKLQVATNLSTEAELADHDPCRDFLRDFVPIADEHIFASR